MNLKRHRHRPLLAVVPLLALSAGVSAASSVHVTGCAGSQLAAKMKVIRGSAGAGHISYSLRLTNNGRKTCALGNHVALRLLKANGRSLPTHVVDVDASETSTIAHGRSLGAELRFSPAIPSGGEPQSAVPASRPPTRSACASSRRAAGRWSRCSVRPPASADTD